MKKIQFNKISEHAGITGHEPSPSTRAIPKWFKEMSKYIMYGNKPSFNGSGSADATIKACPPFLDSMMSGYMIYTEFDIYVSQEGDRPECQWRAGGDLVSYHSKEQLVSEQIPEGYNEQPLKFNNFWQIKTPPGYSTLFTHPLNRTDLPFLTISGVVETDLYENTINFPFLIKEGFEGTIPAGTPIVQLSPFKREVWKMEIGKADLEEVLQSQTKLNHKLLAGYKTQWWRRKEYR